MGRATFLRPAGIGCSGPPGPDRRVKQKAVHSLTEKAIARVPVLAHLGAWGRRHLPVGEEPGIRAQLLEEGGPAMWEQVMAELREAHVGIPAARNGPTVAERLRAAYDEVLAGKSSGRF